MKAIQANPPAGEAGPTNVGASPTAVEAGRCTGVLLSDSANRFTGFQLLLSPAEAERSNE